MFGSCYPSNNVEFSPQRSSLHSTLWLLVYSYLFRLVKTYCEVFVHSGGRQKKTTTYRFCTGRPELSKRDVYVNNGRNLYISFLGKDPSECTKSRHIPTYEERQRSSMIKTASKKSLCRFHAQELVLHLINRAAITSIFRQENRYSYYRNDPVKYDLTNMLEVEYYKM